MRMKFKFIFFMFLLFGIFFGITGNVLADLSGVQYPIVELNSCNSQSECKNFCDDVENIGACLEYAEKNNLMPKKNIEDARKVLPFLESGNSPGGCNTRGSCETYCDLDENFDECLEFSHDAEIISLEVYEIAKVTKGIGPGGCRRDECGSFCSSLENFETCLDFVEDNGLIGVVVSSEDYSISRNMVPLIEEGKIPGDCNSESSCNEYCEDKNNLGECSNFVSSVNGLFVKDLRSERSLKNFEGEEFKGEKDEDIDLDFEDVEKEDEKDEKSGSTTSNDKIFSGGDSSELVRSYPEETKTFEDELFEGEDSEIENPELDIPSEGLEKDIDLVGEVILTKPESNLEEEYNSVEENEVGGDEIQDSGDSEGEEDSKESESESESDSRDSDEDGGSEESESESDKSDSEDSEDSPWTINSRVVAPLQESGMPGSLFDFFKKILSGFY